MFTEKIEEQGPVSLFTEEIQKLRKCLKVLVNRSKTPIPTAIDTILSKPLFGTSLVLSPINLFALYEFIEEERSWA
jgi:hypothetical protein